MKTLKEMAVEYADEVDPNRTTFGWHYARNAYLAGARDGIEMAATAVDKMMAEEESEDEYSISAVESYDQAAQIIRQLLEEKES